MKFKTISVMLFSIASSSAFGQSAGKKKRRPPASINQPQTEIGETPAEVPNAGSTTLETTNSTDGSKQANPWPIKVPSWMFTLGLESTPGIPYEKSNTELQALISSLKASTKIPTNTTTITEVKGTLQDGALMLRHGSLIMSRKIHIGIAADDNRSRIIAESKALSLKSAINKEAPNFRASLAYQARQGLWIGLGSRWGKTFSKSEQTQSVTGTSTKTSSNKEDTSHLVAIEYMGYPGHAGLEYELITESNEVTSITLIPVRIALSDALFLDLELKTKDGEDVSDGSKTRDLSYSFGLGQQFTASAYRLQMTLSSDKSWDSTQYENSRDVIYSLSGAFGSVKGVRYGASLGQYNHRSISTDKSETSISGQIAQLTVSYVQ